MQFLYDKQVVVKRYSSTLGEFNRPNKTLVEVGTYECHTAESSTTTAQLQPQKKNTTDLTLYTDPEAPIKRGDILYIYELDEYPWGDTGWMDYRAKNPPYRRPMNIYECHLGSWLSLIHI